jgi:preprotein translocase subunit YajC
MNDPSGISFFISLLMVFLVMYLLILRPQSKRQKEREAMTKKVGKGDRILTSSGFYGVVVSTKSDDVLLVRFGDNRLSRSRAPPWPPTSVGPREAPEAHLAAVAWHNLSGEPRRSSPNSRARRSSHRRPPRIGL